MCVYLKFQFPQKWALSTQCISFYLKWLKLFYLEISYWNIQNYTIIFTLKLYKITQIQAINYSNNYMLWLNYFNIHIKLKTLEFSLKRIADFHSQPHKWAFKISWSAQFSSVQFSCSVVSNSLWPRELQHTRPPCPSSTPGVYPDSCPLSQWCHLTILSSVDTYHFKFLSTWSCFLNQFFIILDGQFLSIFVFFF